MEAGASPLRPCKRLARRPANQALLSPLPSVRPPPQLRWELGSPLFGLLLRRYAPDDTYTIWKVGGARCSVRCVMQLACLQVCCGACLLCGMLKARPGAPAVLVCTLQVGKRLRVDGTLMGLDDERKASCWGCPAGAGLACCGLAVGGCRLRCCSWVS